MKTKRTAGKANRTMITRREAMKLVAASALVALPDFCQSLPMTWYITDEGLDLMNETCGTVHQGCPHELVCDLPKGHTEFHEGGVILFPDENSVVTRHSWMYGAFFDPETQES